MLKLISITFLLFLFSCKPNTASEGVSPSTSPSPSPTPSPAPAPSPTPAPTGWVATPGALTNGTWHDPAELPDVGHAGAYGGIAVAPNNDVYLFYQTGAFPNENLQSVIRRSGGSSWSAEYFVANRCRLANVYFDNNQPYIATESGGSAVVYTSANYTNNAPQVVTWNMQQCFQASDGNPDGYGVYGNAFLTKYQSNFHLFHTYLYYSAVTGASLWGMNLISQSASAWPAAGSFGTPLDNYKLVPYIIFPHGATGAYNDGAGKFLAFSKIALRSTDSAANFSQIMNSGTDANDLNGVIATCQNSADGSIVVANRYFASMSYKLALWGTQDFGSNFYKLNELSYGSEPKRGTMTCTKNLIIFAYTIDSGSGEKEIHYSKSADGGQTWSAAATLVDVTNANANPTYSVGSLALSSNTSGTVVVTYSVVEGNTHRGVYVKEFY